MSALYDDPTVRRRLVEFLGGDSLAHATAAYLTHPDGHAFQLKELRPSSELDWFLDHDLDVARSLADRASLLLHLDVEYVNFDSPLEAYVDPWRAFDLQEPAIRVIESLLLEWDIRPLHIVTGQGHHFVWRIPLASETALRMMSLCPDTDLAAACSDRAPVAFRLDITPEAQRAFSALSLIMEYVAHRVKQRSAPLCELPVELTAVHVGPGKSGMREIVSIDISEYGDPLHTRMIRLPFTRYLKPWVSGDVESSGMSEEIPAIITVPLHEMDVRQAITMRQVEAEVLELAHRACARIPLQTEGTSRLLEEYLASDLRKFHECFYATQHDPKNRWHETYARTPLSSLPPCCSSLIEYPNDRLLKPAGMQLVTRCLMAAGWHPRHVAGLVRSKFEDPSFGWGVDWAIYDPATRADFYCRVFSGLYETGVDELVDFNCASTREKGFCFPPGSGPCCLEPSRAELTSQSHLP